MDFKQAYVSNTLEYWKKGLFDKWNFEEYTDPMAPAFFLGIYSREDLEIFENHKGYKILFFGGNDFRDNQIKAVQKSKNTVCVGYGGEWLAHGCKANKLPFDDTRVWIRDFDDFKPSVLGDKIYVYKGRHGNRADYFEWDNVIVPLMDRIGEDRFIYTEHTSLEELKENYYEKSFVYIKPNPRAGSTAMMELGYMGRRTLTLGHDIFPNVLRYNSISNMVNLIRREESRIGTIPRKLVIQLNKFCKHNNDWLNINHYNWKKLNSRL